MRLGPLHISFRRASEVAQETPHLRQRVQRLEIALTEFQEHFATLQRAHVTLRNQFNGAKGGRPPHEAARNQGEIPFGDKAALRRHFGIVRSAQPGANSE